MSKELKPCPFCEGEDIRITEHKDYARPVFSMCCYSCGATFPNRYKRSVLVNLWNTRPDSKKQ